MWLNGTKEFIHLVKLNEVDKVVKILDTAYLQFHAITLNYTLNESHFDLIKDKYLVH